MYRRALRRVRHELEQLPTEDQLHRIEQAAQYLESLSEIWDDAEEGDQRDLLRLMVREVQVDVAQSRLMLLSPTAPFIPLFRSVSFLEERDLGIFTPVWSPEIVESLPLPYPSLPPLAGSTAASSNGCAPPFLLNWPWQLDSGARISPALSAALKERRKVGVEGGRVIEIPKACVPPLRLDTRKWEDVTLEGLSLDEALALPPGSISYLETPLALQEHADRKSLVEKVFQLLEQQGYWHFCDLLPASMPAHWLYTHFPDTWTLARGAFWNAYQFYNALREQGFYVRQEEHTFYQPVNLDTACEIAQQRSGLLGLLSDEAYRSGLDKLTAAVQEQGREARIGSEVTLVEVTALKGEPPKRKWRRKRKS